MEPKRSPLVEHSCVPDASYHCNHRFTDPRVTPIGRDVDHPSAIDVGPDGTPASPLRQVVLELGFQDEFVQRLELTWAAASAPDRMSYLVLATIAKR